MVRRLAEDEAGDWDLQSKETGRMVGTVGFVSRVKPTPEEMWAMLSGWALVFSEVLVRLTSVSRWI